MASTRGVKENASPSVRSRPWSSDDEQHHEEQHDIDDTGLVERC